jgi:cellulose biosynthesis protein BcsQ
MRALRFLTWLDVRRVIRKKNAYGRQLPAGVNSINCFSDAIEISLVNNDDQALMESELQNWFGEWYQKENQFIQLDLGNSVLPVEFLVEGKNNDVTISIRPFWEEIAYIGGESDEPKDLPKDLLPEPYQDSPSLVAFHSFKGGVGRTTHLAAYLFALLERAKEINKPITVLVVDADLEAPGLTYWNRVEKQQPAVSFLDFLEAYHYSPLPEQETLDLFATEVKKSQSPKHEGVSTAYFLPACLSDEQLLDTPILPENLTRTLGNVWTFSDAIHQLGKALKADYVIVDLRAGLSEISSPLIFDPRVQRFFVTTASTQSVSGLELVLKQVSRIASSQEDVENGKYFDPTVIISFLTPEMKKLSEFDDILVRFRTAYIQDTFVDDSSTRLEIKETDFLQELLYINNWEDARLKLSTTSEIARFAKEWAASQLSNSPQLKASDNLEIETNLTTESDTSSNLLEQVRRFRDVCEQYEFAEKGTGEGLLITETLKNLATNFRFNLPRIVSIGAKGAGKTFIYVQLSRLKYWENFLRIALREESKSSELKEESESRTCIFPFLQSKNLHDNAKNIIETAREEVRLVLNGDTLNFQHSEYVDRIQGSLNKNLTELEWTKFWINEIARSLGMQIEEKSEISIQEINNYLRRKKIRIVFLFDGLEDIFQEAASNEKQKVALRALINLPNDRLSEIRQANLGLIILLRRDFLRYAITQNVGQFESLYSSYDLSWDVDSFLKLVYWVCVQGGVIGTPEDKKDREDKVDSLGREELVKQLEKLWGEKLGGKNEARTASWVFAALTDFNGRLQARDIVRLLFHAADITVDRSKEIQFDKWSSSRLLPPQAIRRALDPCSDKKVNEAKEEYPEFKKWVEKIDTYAQEQKRIPFQPQDLGLDPATIRMLEAIGVIYEDRAKDDVSKYYMPEIFRAGLKFNLATVARPRVLALKRKVLGIGVL